MNKEQQQALEEMLQRLIANTGLSRPEAHKELARRLQEHLRPGGAK